MSLYERARGASLVEYALLLFLFIGGAAAAVKSTGLAARDVFEQRTASELGAFGQGEDVGLGAPPGRGDAGR